MSWQCNLHKGIRFRDVVSAGAHAKECPGKIVFINDIIYAGRQ